MEIQLWKELLQPYEQAVTELTAKFNCLRDEYRKNNQHSPIETVSGRVKTVTSILEKMQKKVYTETGLYNSEKRGKPNNEKNKNRMYHRSRKQYQGNAYESGSCRYYHNR